MTKGRLGTGLVIFLAITLLAGGRGLRSEGPGRVIVEEIKVSPDGQRVESIMVQADDGKELSLRPSEVFDPAVWSPQHLQGHVQGAKNLVLTIGIDYMETGEGGSAARLFE